MTLLDLKRQILTMVFNSDGRVSPDVATRQVLSMLPTEGIFDLLFEGRNDYDGLHKADRD